MKKMPGKKKEIYKTPVYKQPRPVVAPTPVAGASNIEGGLETATQEKLELAPMPKKIVKEDENKPDMESKEMRAIIEMKVREEIERRMKGVEKKK